MSPSHRLSGLLAALPLSTCVAGAFLVGACRDGREAVVVYSPHGRDLLEVVEAAFEADHPGIDLRWLDMGSQEVLERIRSERANPQADVWFGGPSVLFSRAAGSGYLAPLEANWAAALDPGLRADDGTWAALYLTPTLLVYNEDALTGDEAPADWDDLLEERWRDQVLIRDPLASGTMRTIFGYLLLRGTLTGAPLEESVEEGFRWLARLDAQTREYVPSPALLHEKMVRQEGLVTVWEMTDILTRRARGAPLGYRFPTSGAPVIEDSVARVAGSPNPDGGRLLVEWLGQDDALRLAAEEAFRLPARPEVEGLPPWVDEVRGALRPVDMPWDLLEERGAEWMSRWDREIRARGGSP